MNLRGKSRLWMSPWNRVCLTEETGWQRWETHPASPTDCQGAGDAAISPLATA
ncbi:hypothetical protein PAMP_005036 [Pampus punctatissimus]